MKGKRLSRPYRPTRPRPAAYAADPASVGQKARPHGRTIMLTTGRGDTRITPDEAAALVADLQRAIRETAPCACATQVQ